MATTDNLKFQENKSGLFVSGFSLLELIICISIIAILALIALPNYSHQVHKQQRVGIQQKIMQCAGNLERQYSLLQNYTTDACDLISHPKYQISIDTNCANANEQQCYLIHAQAVEQRDSHCQYFSYNHYGQTFASDNQQQDSTQRCWNF